MSMLWSKRCTEAGFWKSSPCVWKVTNVNSKIYHVRKNSVYISFHFANTFQKNNIQQFTPWILIPSWILTEPGQVGGLFARYDVLCLSKSQGFVSSAKHVKKKHVRGFKSMERWKKISLTSGLGQYGLPKTRVCLYLRWNLTAVIVMCRSKEQALEYYAGALLGVAQLQKLSRLGGHGSIQQQ